MVPLFAGPHYLLAASKQDNRPPFVGFTIMSPAIQRFSLALILTVSFIPGSARSADEPYDPLTKPTEKLAAPLDLVVQDEARSREIPVRVYLPANTSTAPVVLFSHGLGGSRANSAYLAEHWAARGYVCTFMQHPGSDETVWRGKPLTERMAELRQAAGLQNFMLRAKDVPAVLDQLARWNDDEMSELKGRLDLSHVGMSGHSFGAVTTQAVSGQHYPLGGTSLTDKRIKAAVAFSPSAPRAGDASPSFGDVKIPWMLMTGTKDVAPIGGATVETRLAVFPALPPGDKYELVLYNAEHSAFGDRNLPGDKEKRNPNHHRLILALSTAFWDAYLRDDPQAKAWLQGDGPKRLLEPKDRWQYK
jgi:predicted dienelactone hydrolase